MKQALLKDFRMAFSLGVEGGEPSSEEGQAPRETADILPLALLFLYPHPYHLTLKLGIIS